MPSQTSCRLSPSKVPVRSRLRVLAGRQPGAEMWPHATKHEAAPQVMYQAGSTMAATACITHLSSVVKCLCGPPCSRYGIKSPLAGKATEIASF